MKNKLLRYKSIFSKEIYDYLESVLNLEISPLDRSAINKEDFEIIKKMDIYNELTRYAIYNHAKNTLNHDSRIELHDDKNSISAKLSKLYDVDQYIFLYIPVLDQINLYELNINSNFRKQKIEHINKKIEDLNNEIKKNKIAYENNPQINLVYESIMEVLVKDKMDLDDIVLDLINRNNNIELAKEISEVLEEYSNRFMNFHNITDEECFSEDIRNINVGNDTYRQLSLKIGNTKYTKNKNYY